MSKKYKITQEIVDAFNKVKLLEEGIGLAMLGVESAGHLVMANALASALAGLGELGVVGSVIDEAYMTKASSIAGELYYSLSEGADEYVCALKRRLEALEEYEDPSEHHHMLEAVEAIIKGKKQWAVVAITHNTVMTFSSAGVTDAAQEFGEQIRALADKTIIDQQKTK